MSNVNPKIYDGALYEAATGLHGQKLSEALGRFVRLLGRRQSLKRAEQIMSEFVFYAKREAGIREIEIESARPLGQATAKSIKSVFGDKVEATEKVSQDLLGGIVVKTGDTIFDGSLRRQLVRLKSLLV